MDDAFVERLADAIRASGLKKNEIARRVGVTPGTLSGYLAGRMKPDRPVLILLAQVLNTTEEALLSETTKAEDKAEKLAVQEDLVVYIPDAVALTGLDADDRRTVIRLLNALRSGDAEVRWHLIRQLKIIEHALTARRQMPPEDLDAAQ
jgi:transcriptional regulator with XRE-family HTH domain